MAINNKRRTQVFEKYNGRCAYCGVGINATQFHIDHIQPKCFGGTDELDNLNPSCRDCNTYKSNWSLESFRENLKHLLNLKLEYLFKSMTKMNVAVKFGAVKLSEWNGLFYYELPENQSNDDVLW